MFQSAEEFKPADKHTPHNDINRPFMVDYSSQYSVVKRHIFSFQLCFEYYERQLLNAEEHRFTDSI
jgi:hypothetical protein